MNEQERKYTGIQRLIEDFCASERPIDKYLAHVLKELYFSGKYRFAIIRGAKKDEKRTLNTLRIVGWREDMLVSHVISTSADKEQHRQTLDLLLGETARLPVNVGDFAPLLPAASNKLLIEHLTTAAAMEISKSQETGLEIVEVFYPRIFMELLPLLEEYRSDFGFGVSCCFLKIVPFGSGDINIRVPSH